VRKNHKRVRRFCEIYINNNHTVFYAANITTVWPSFLSDAVLGALSGAGIGADLSVKF